MEGRTGKWMGVRRTSANVCGSRCRHQSPSERWWTHFPGLRHPASNCQEHRTSYLSPTEDPTLRSHIVRSPSTSTANRLSLHRSPTTRSTSMSTARTSSSRPWSPTTAPFSSPTTAAWSPRSSVVQVHAPGTRSLTDRCGAVVWRWMGTTRELASIAATAHWDGVLLYVCCCST